MQTVTLSPKFQIVIPLPIRRKMGLTAGQPMRIMERDGYIKLFPERDIKDLKGFLRGINTDFDREDARL